LEPTYYVYVSDAKVDMLLGSIPERQRRTLALELKVDLKIISATAKSEEAVPTQTRFGRLAVVAKHLRDTAFVGPLNSPAEYIADTCPVSWWDYPAVALGETESGAITVFAGRTSNTTFALFGSGVHVIGRQSTKPAMFSSSPAIVSFLKQEFGDVRSFSSPTVMPAPAPIQQVLAATLDAAENILSMVPGQSMEFLARRLLSGTIESDGKKMAVTIATPLYVALAS
jgi:hypothetical protein